MFAKFALFSLLVYLTGNPIIALIVLLIILYVIDRRYVGLTPSVLKPIKSSRKLAMLQQELRLNPHHTSNKLEAARILVAKKRYKAALKYLEEISQTVEDSAEVWYETGYCHMMLGHLDEGETFMRKAFELNPRVKYGEGYLRLGEAFAGHDQDKAIRYLEQFKDIQSSSCEGYYRLGQIYSSLNRTREAKEAFGEIAKIYRGLPRYLKRKERRWAILASFRG